ncbi:hypothetical protein KF728_28045 [Candidatus Obscuribacterales bacterium]|nr:hypothetical protein [Candidatus Obscuribacterales bacterium]
MKTRTKNAKPYMVALAIIGCIPTSSFAAEPSPFSSPGSAEYKAPPKTFEEVPIDKDASTIYEDVLPKLDPMMTGHGRYIDALVDISSELMTLKYYDKAEQILNRAWELTNTFYAMSSSKIAVKSALCDLSKARGDLRQAISFAQDAADISSESCDPDTQPLWDHAGTLFKLALLQLQVDRNIDAEKNIRTALRYMVDNRESSQSRRNYTLDCTYLNRVLARSLAKQGRVNEACKVWEQFIKECAEFDAPNFGQTMTDVSDYAAFLRQNNREAKAASYTKKFNAHRANIIKNYGPYESYQLRMLREAEQRKRVSPKDPPRFQVDPARNKEANAGSLS